MWSVPQSTDAQWAKKVSEGALFYYLEIPVFLWDFYERLMLK